MRIVPRDSGIVFGVAPWLIPSYPLSAQVMTVVKQLVYDDVTICATIHSPTSYCFSLFDKLMMLVRGQVVYFGKGGSAGGAGEGLWWGGCSYLTGWPIRHTFLF